MPLPKDILSYNAAQSPTDKAICNALAKAIDEHLPSGGNKGGHGELECKIWHRHPVWFLDGNPIVGYHKLKGDGGSIRLLFWSGQSFDEPGLPPSPPDTKFKTGAAHFTSVDEISAKDLKRWLKKSAEIQWDYKNIVKRRGKLERLK
jgi:hypothetical protein